MKNLSFDIEKVRQGDWASFHRLFKVLYPRLITLASRFVDECTAEDLVQNVFLFYWERKETIDINDIKSFLYKCTQNSCLDHLKHQMVVEEYERKVRIGEARLLWMEEHSDENEVMKSVINQDLQDIINESIDKLSPKCAKVFRLCYFEDMSHKAIADTMGLSTRTVEWHIRQAIIFLRKDLHRLFILILCFSTYK
ncbi:RNA polymerase sigma-70 factor [uncultured Parabacteroides sp.]|uniref:RNA polymerase sigma-70 factor n=1 Tax=uncultured Parabacteroides sp. TaxID=512312 RepID=UPI0025D63850|nr:RNA polymerase sigma-70 factor [uncultured Parabacteroides sp.]